MPYELKPYEPSESVLFWLMNGEKGERHGQIGYMRMDFGGGGNQFWTTWFDNQVHLKNNAFKEKFNVLVNNLRSDIFKNRNAMMRICGGKRDESLDNRGTGFKLQSEGYTYALRCWPGVRDYDALIYPYDDRYLLPELAGQHELPNDCEAVLPSTGEIIKIVMGEAEYIPLAKSTPDRALNRQLVSADNALMGVTRAQEEAMLAGLLQGWDMPTAKPWNYDMDGKPRVLPGRDKDAQDR